MGGLQTRPGSGLGVEKKHYAAPELHEHTNLLAEAECEDMVSTYFCKFSLIY